MFHEKKTVYIFFLNMRCASIEKYFRLHRALNTLSFKYLFGRTIIIHY